MKNIVCIFFMFWGVLFAGIPLATIISTGLQDSGMYMLFIFVIVGAIVFFVGLRNFLRNLRLKRIKKKGTQTMGLYIDSASNFSMNGTPLYYIKFSFINNDGKSIEVKTQSLYTVRQVEFYEKLGRFEIKYINDTAVISQPIDYRLLQKMNDEETKRETPLTPLEPSEKPTIKHGYYFCDYCGNEQEKTGRCKSCGAKITSKNYREK